MAASPAAPLPQAESSSPRGRDREPRSRSPPSPSVSVHCHSPAPSPPPPLQKARRTTPWSSSSRLRSPLRQLRHRNRWRRSATATATAPPSLHLQCRPLLPLLPVSAPVSRARRRQRQTSRSSHRCASPRRSGSRRGSAWGPEESCSSCNMAEQQDMAMVLVPVDAKDQEHGTAVAEAEGTANKKVVIDVEKETEKPERKELAPRSEMWQHFIKIKDDKGFLKAGKCKYCHHDIKADPNSHGTSALRKHFSVCKKNPHLFNKDPNFG